MVCVCRLQGTCLRVRLTHNGEVVGLEEQYHLNDSPLGWKLIPRSDKADKFSLVRNLPNPNENNSVSFKAETKDEGFEWIEAIAKARNPTGPAPSSSKQDTTSAENKPAGVGIVFKEIRRQGRGSHLLVKSLAPGGAAISSGMIEEGDVLHTVNGARVTTTEEATRLILGPKGSPIEMVFERNGERYQVDMRRGITAKTQ
uniref:PDZ domain-containing protein n=1 Tax=Guillardia theta TaxID=55529 RepID=A0A7S4PJR5_GUITH|mmetsp:Transcript_5240/g.18671  ORF Transcript_5240/g.18671 Transcript_5240/m.18671 type:complete len:200 (+) Transcript_5240:185-784(+)